MSSISFRPAFMAVLIAMMMALSACNMARQAPEQGRTPAPAQDGRNAGTQMNGNRNAGTDMHESISMLVRDRFGQNQAVDTIIVGNLAIIGLQDVNNGGNNNNTGASGTSMRGPNMTGTPGARSGNGAGDGTGPGNMNAVPGTDTGTNTNNNITPNTRTTNPSGTTNGSPNTTTGVPDNPTQRSAQDMQPQRSNVGRPSDIENVERPDASRINVLDERIIDEIRTRHPNIVEVLSTTDPTISGWIASIAMDVRQGQPIAGRVIEIAKIVDLLEIRTTTPNSTDRNIENNRMEQNQNQTNQNR